MELKLYKFQKALLIIAGLMILSSVVLIFIEGQLCRAFILLLGGTVIFFMQVSDSAMNLARYYKGLVEESGIQSPDNDNNTGG